MPQNWFDGYVRSNGAFAFAGDVALKDGFGQIMHKEATKGKAVAALAQHYGIKQSETVAFGDDLNDKDLLSWAGVGVAMGNAADEIMAVADEVCLSNEDDGIAVWIEENIQEVEQEA